MVCDKKTEDSIKDLLDLLNEEINVKQIYFERDTSKFMIKSLKPNYSSIGKRFHEKSKSILDELEKIDKNKLYDKINREKKIEIKLKSEKITLKKDDFLIIEKEKDHIARTETEDVILIINTKLTPELIAEGFAREIIRRIQSMRKELDLDVEDKISAELKVDKDKMTALKQWESYIKGETRSKKINYVEKPSGELVKKWKIDEIDVEIGIFK